MSVVDAGRQMQPALCNPFLGRLARKLHLAHGFFDARFDGLQLEHQEQSLEDRNVEFFLAQEFAQAAALVFPIRGPTIINCDALEGLHVDVEIETVVTFAGQDDLDVVGIDALVVGSLQEAFDALEDAMLQCPSLVLREAARHQEIAIGRKRLVRLFEIEQHREILLLTPIVEIAKKAPRIGCLSRRPKEWLRQAIEERESGHRMKRSRLRLSSGSRMSIGSLSACSWPSAGFASKSARSECVGKGSVSGVNGHPQNLPTTLRNSPNFCFDPNHLCRALLSEWSKILSSVAVLRRGKMTSVSARPTPNRGKPRVDDTLPSASLPCRNSVHNVLCCLSDADL